MSKAHAAVAAAAVLLLGACSGGSTTPAAPVVTAVAIPSPDAAQATALLAALGAIDPSLNEAKSVSRARSMCSSILANAKGEGGVTPLVDVVRTRFTADQLTDAQAQAVIEAIQSSTWCAE